MTERYYLPGTKPKNDNNSCGCAPSSYADKANLAAMKGSNGHKDIEKRVVSSELGDQFNLAANKGSGAAGNN